MNRTSITQLCCIAMVIYHAITGTDSAQKTSPSLICPQPSTIRQQASGKWALDNRHDIDQKVIITPPRKDPTDCTQFHGKEFMDCMACQSSENLKKNLQNCNDRMTHFYFDHLSLEEYHETLQNFTEKEWEQFYASRKSESQENFPRTLEEQRVMLKQLYLDAYFYHWSERLLSGQSELKTDDLEKVIQDFNARWECGWLPARTKLILYSRFYCFRKKLFTKPAH